MFEALLYDKVDGAVKCRLCPHHCTIADGRRGICGIRENQGGRLYALTYGLPCALHVDPIEKKPLYHFQPGSMSYSVATVGCNLKCRHCQNWQISQMCKKGGKIVGEEVSPEAIVEGALASGCSSVSYTYTEPTVYMEYALDTAKIAVDKGLKNVFVSNGYMTEDAVELISPYLHADNVDLKSFSDKFYREVCGAMLEPVLRTLKMLVKKGVWVEVTTLIIPSLNDGKDELKEIAKFISTELGDFVPWHVSRFHPDFELTNLPATDVKAIEGAVKIGKDAGLKYVYAGNVPHGRYENTYCPKCGELLLERHGFSVTSNKVKDGGCTKCKTRIEGVWQ
ncbi:MAG: AmmeMemoRadiSam system radical SAM enzyme [Candidatus Altiarchaeota archaeon]